MFVCDPVPGGFLITPPSGARIGPDNGPRAARPEEFRDGGQQMSEQDEQVSHGGET